MADETRTIYGRNGRNSNFVQNETLVTPSKTMIYSQSISSTYSMKHHFVRKCDGVPFGSNRLFENGKSYPRWLV